MHNENLSCRTHYHRRCKSWSFIDEQQDGRNYQTTQRINSTNYQQSMTNPYVENLVQMGYDRADCETVAVAGLAKTFPMNIHGRVYQTQEEYDEALHDFLNGM